MCCYSDDIWVTPELFGGVTGGFLFYKLKKSIYTVYKYESHSF